jgi:hypothetical protein
MARRRTRHLAHWHEVTHRLNESLQFTPPRDNKAR